jgi:hypothetical protein
VIIKVTFLIYLNVFMNLSQKKIGLSKRIGSGDDGLQLVGLNALSAVLGIAA